MGSGADTKPEEKGDKLKSCPFCSGVAIQVYRDSNETSDKKKYFVECCDMSLGGFYTEEESVEAWNTRSH